jgi:hypothetical protein
MPRPRETKRRCSLRVSQVQRGLRTRSPRGVRSPPPTLSRLVSRCFESLNYERRGMTRNLLLCGVLAAQDIGLGVTEDPRPRNSHMT